MNPAQSAFDQAIEEADKLRRTLRRNNSLQVKRVEERTNAKATALSWFNTHRASIVACLGERLLAGIDDHYNHLLTYCDKTVTRIKYIDTINQVRRLLLDLRAANIVTISSFVPTSSTDAPPDFSTLVSDPEMKAILLRRWNECLTCVQAKAPLAATVMMGGLLETLLLTRVHQFPDKPKIFTATTAPRDKAGTTLPLSEWTLRHYIDVAHELGWITQTEKDLGVVLRDYRNYIHPHKERTHGVNLQPNDSLILWELSKNISRQLLSGNTT